MREPLVKIHVEGLVPTLQQAIGFLVQEKGFKAFVQKHATVSGAYQIAIPVSGKNQERLTVEVLKTIDWGCWHYDGSPPGGSGTTHHVYLLASE